MGKTTERTDSERTTGDRNTTSSRGRGRRALGRAFVLVAPVVLGFGLSQGACSSEADPGTNDASTTQTDANGTAETSVVADAGGTDTSTSDGSLDASDAAADTSTSDGSFDASDATADSAVDATVDAMVDAGPPEVRFVGRWDTRLAGTPRAAYPGSRVVARFDGTEVSVTLGNTTGFAGGPSRYDVFVDDVLQPAQLVTQTGTRTYPLATGLAPGVHKIELYKRTEGNLGVTTFMGFSFGAGQLLAPPPASAHKIEFVSDSTIDGYGVEGAGPNCPAGTLEASHSARKGLAGLVTSDLSADAIMVAYSGKGLWQNSYRPDTETMGVLYPRTLPDDATSLWDFSRFVPDVVVVSLGGSDYSKVGPADDPAPLAQFTQKYDDLYGMIRTYAPDAHVFLTIYAQIKDVYPPNYFARTNLNNAINQVIANHPGDTKVYKFVWNESVPSQETGCQYHGGPALQRSLADALVPVIKAKTGW